VNVRGKGLSLEFLGSPLTRHLRAKGDWSEPKKWPPANIIAVRPLKTVDLEFEITEAMLEYFTGVTKKHRPVPVLEW
jgi:hypothetical protein